MVTLVMSPDHSKGRKTARLTQTDILVTFALRPASLARAQAEFGVVRQRYEQVLTIMTGLGSSSEFRGVVYVASYWEVGLEVELSEWQAAKLDRLYRVLLLLAAPPLAA